MPATLRTTEDGGFGRHRHTFSLRMPLGNVSLAPDTLGRRQPDSSVVQRIIPAFRRFDDDTRGEVVDVKTAQQVFQPKVNRLVGRRGSAAS